MFLQQPLTLCWVVKPLIKMPKLIRTEVDYHYYGVELTEEQYKLYCDDPDAFWDNDELQEELYDEMELLKTKPVNGDYYVEE